MDAIIQKKHTNLQHLRAIMEWEPYQIIKAWVTFHENKPDQKVTVEYMYEKSHVGESTKVLSKITIKKNSENEIFFFTCVGHKTMLRNTMTFAKYEAESDLVNYSKILAQDHQFQAYMLNEDFLEPKTNKRRRIDDSGNNTHHHKRKKEEPGEKERILDSDKTLHNKRQDITMKDNNPRKINMSLVCDEDASLTNELESYHKKRDTIRKRLEPTNCNVDDIAKDLDQMSISDNEE